MRSKADRNQTAASSQGAEGDRWSEPKARTPAGAPGSATARRASRSIPQRKAASVFPDPVGAQIRVLAPATIFGHPIAWAGVGSANDASNQRLTGSLNAVSGVDLAVSECTGLNRPILRTGRT